MVQTLDNFKSALRFPYGGGRRRLGEANPGEDIPRQPLSKSVKPWRSLRRKQFTLERPGRGREREYAVL